MDMKVLVYGSKGWIGSQVCQYLEYNQITVYYGESRVDNNTTLEQEINEYKPTNIMCFIGKTHGKIGEKIYGTIDYLEQDGKLVENLRDNLYSPLLLALLCQKYNIHLTYLGTGCIFEYDNEHPYGIEKNGFKETDDPNFFGSSYSVVKGFTDRLMHLLEKNVLNLRIRMPITSKNNPRNFITKIINYKKICSIPNSMTVLDDFIPIIVDMANKKITGTFNMTNPGLISHNEILEMYKELIDPNFKWENFSINDQDKILDAKRSNNYLDSEKLIALYPQIDNIKASVYKIIKNFKNN